MPELRPPHCCELVSVLPKPESRRAAPEAERARGAGGQGVTVLPARLAHSPAPRLVKACTEGRGGQEPARAVVPTPHKKRWWWWFRSRITRVLHPLLHEPLPQHPFCPSAGHRALPGSTQGPWARPDGKEGWQKRGLGSGVTSRRGGVHSLHRNPPPSPLLPLPAGEEAPTLAKHQRLLGQEHRGPAARWRWQLASRSRKSRGRRGGWSRAACRGWVGSCTTGLRVLGALGKRAQPLES